MEQLTAFRVTALVMEGFKCFADPIKFEFGNLTSITGHNAQGKSSIADAIAFAITGVPFFGGTRIDRLYHGEGKYIRVRLELLDGEGKPHVLDRRRSDDRMEIAFDGVMTTQNNLTMLFGERDVFLSIFNPLYFIQVLGRDGRNLLERYLPAIPHEKVLEALSEPVRTQLDGVDFLSAEACLKEARAEVKELERDCTYLEGQRDLLKTQADGGRMTLLAKQNEYQTIKERIAALETKKQTGFDGRDLKEQLADLYARYEELQREAAAPPPASTLDGPIQETAQALERRRAEAYQPKYAEPIAQAQAQIEALRTELARQTRILQGLAPGVQCPMCKQVVTQETLPAVRKEFEQSAAGIRYKGREKTAQLAEIQELEQKARETFEQFQRDDVVKLEAQLTGLKTQKEQAEAQAAKEAGQRQAQLTEIRGQIQSIEMDLETGMLTGEELMELTRAKEQETILSAEIAALSDQVEAADVDDKAAALEEMRRQIKEKGILVSNLLLYISKRAELVLESLSMNKVAIQLYDVVKATGEAKDAFKFTYDGRPYTELSTSEQIKAGLEVSQLMMRLTNRAYPVFIDNGESVPVIDNIRPAGQVLLSQVVKGAPLEVRSLDASAAGKAA